MDEWQVDLAVAGSQKGLMLPAGLGILCASPRALAAREQAKSTRAFFDLGEMIKANATGYFPYTPPCSCCTGCASPSTCCSTEGFRPGFARHQRLGEGCAPPSAPGAEALRKAPPWYSKYRERHHGAGWSECRGRH